MTWVYLIVFPAIGLMFASAVYGLYWASKTGQLKHLEKGATVIFDQDEPIGKTTDQFPEETLFAKKETSRS